MDINCSLLAELTKLPIVINSHKDLKTMQKLVLVIDDNDEFREILAELLNLNGFEVDLADSGAMALKLLKERIPDLIMCDIVMSEMGGYEVLNAVRTNEQFRDIPFIFSTALSEKADRLKSELNNVNHYLVKPYNETELIACINKCLKQCNQQNLNDVS